MTDQAWAKSLLEGIEKVRRKANEDERSTAAYWNCDEWGSISGHKDAIEWVEGQITTYIVSRLAERDRAKAKG